MFDESGSEVWGAEIDAYGGLRNVRGERAECPFRWPGQYEDIETGLYYTEAEDTLRWHGFQQTKVSNCRQRSQDGRRPPGLSDSRLGKEIVRRALGIVGAAGA